MFFAGIDRNNINCEFAIAQALQQTKLKLNHIGAKVESAVAIRMMRCASFRKPKPPLAIDKPFFVWATRDGMAVPYFSGYITEEDWKEQDKKDDED